MNQLFARANHYDSIFTTTIQFSKKKNLLLFFLSKIKFTTIYYLLQKPIISIAIIEGTCMSYVRFLNYYDKKEEPLYILN